MPELEIESVPLEGATRVVLSGELDLAGVPALERVLDEAVQASDGVLLLDMCELDFVDSSGLTALLRTRALLGREDRELALICPHGPVRRVFELAGIADLFPFYASRAEAAEAFVPRQN